MISVLRQAGKKLERPRTSSKFSNVGMQNNLGGSENASLCLRVAVITSQQSGNNIARINTQHVVPVIILCIHLLHRTALPPFLLT